MIVRLPISRPLLVLAITLPLAACAAQPSAPDAAAATQAAAAPRAAPAPAAPAPAAHAPAAAAAQPAAAQPDNHEADQPTSVTPAARTPAARTPRASGAAPHGATGRAAPSDAAPATSAAADAGAPAAADTTAQPAPAAPAAGPAAGTAGAPAPAAPAPGTTMPAGSPTGSLLQTLFALVLVLAVLGALAWFLKRYGPRAGGGTANLRVVGSLSLGGRERLLVVEVGNQWIVVGASPGRVNALATMPKQEGHGAGGEGASLAPHVPAANSFADWLRQTIDKRK